MRIHTDLLKRLKDTYPFVWCMLVFCSAVSVAIGGMPVSMFFDQDLLEDPPAGQIRVRLTQIASGLNGAIGEVTQFLPTDLVPFPDGSGRLGVLTLGGVVRVIDPASGLVGTPYLITANEDTIVEPGNFGIISMAFHPDFAQIGEAGFGKFYIIETEHMEAGVPDFDGSLEQTAFGGVHHDVLYEYTTGEPSSDIFSGTRRALMRVEQPGWDHNLFDLTFGIGDEANILYISSGDGANASAGTPLIRDNAQFTGNVFGKVLRIDPLGDNSVNEQYGIPQDNPFLGDAGALPELYTYGHRSCYRLTVDSQTGDLWLGEVGQRQIEEINRLDAGMNYGWPLKEGSFLFDELDHDNNQLDPDLDSNGNGDFADANGLVDPVFELDHQTARSITGGFVYRSDSIPGLNGIYVFGDAFGNGLFYGDPNDGSVSGQTGGVERFLVDPTGVQVPFGAISIGQDSDGELYMLTFDGRVLRLDPWACSEVDFIADGTLNFSDVSGFLAAFSDQDPRADLNGDSNLNFLDVSSFLTLFGQGCP